MSAAFGWGFPSLTRNLLYLWNGFCHSSNCLQLIFQDDDSMDNDGNELDGECSRPQKHAKSPELAREFLLDAASVIFKEQVCSAMMRSHFSMLYHIK